MYLIAGPCSIEGEGFIEIAKACKEAGATHIRGGVFKPRSSPFRWCGLGEEALPFVVEMKAQVGLPFVAEAMSPKQIEILYPYVDILQCGTRNATNTELLKEFGRQDKPVIYKRGMAQTIEEFVMGADFILNEGNKNVILCERGIRSFDPFMRNVFDVGCIAAVKQICALPIIADPSHGTGKASLVPSVARAAIAAGADGLIVEVHDDPAKAMTDGEQSITPRSFGFLVGEVERVWWAVHD